MLRLGLSLSQSRNRLPTQGLIGKWLVRDGLVDTIGLSSGPICPGLGLLGNGTTYISIPGLLTSDTITAESADTPNCGVNGRLDIEAGDKVWGISITRDGSVIGFYPCAEKYGTYLINTITSDIALPVGTLSNTDVRTTIFDGTGFDINKDGFSVADSHLCADRYGDVVLVENALCPFAMYSVYNGVEA